MITRQLVFKLLYDKVFQPSSSVKFLRSFHNEHQLFDRMSPPNLVPLHHSMLTCLDRNRPYEALRIFKNQLRAGLTAIDEIITALAAKACRGDLKLGCQIHGFALASGRTSYLSVSNSLMHMYSKSGQLTDAFCIFHNLDDPDIVSWNTMLSGFEDANDALNFACRMNLLGVPFDAVTYTTALALCRDVEEFAFGIQLHSHVLKVGMECEVFIGNALVTLYSEWGHIIEAERVFSEMPNKDLVSWNAMISGYSQEGSYGLDAIWVFIEMVRRGMKLDHVSFTSSVSACGHARYSELGKQIHGLALKRGYGRHLSVCNVLISTYMKSGDVEDANLAFKGMVDRNVVSWTTMITLNEENAVTLFNDMRKDGVPPNEVTYVGLLHSISTNKSVKEGLMVHGLCLKTNFFSKLNVANSFITMYAKFESMQDSVKIFEETDNRGIISWNALISGYAQNGMFEEALQIFSLAITESEPNEYTFGSLLSAIGSSESISLKHGQWCHSYLAKLGLNSDPIVLGALLDMYAKRGSICESHRVFSEIGMKNQVAWTAIISAHARHGDFESVMDLYKEMEREAFKPDSITFLSVLTACGRKGMVDEGKKIFESMVKVHEIEPSLEHYSCMVDMLGRAGRLKEAEEFATTMPGGPGFSLMQSLLGSCKVHGNMEIGERVGDALLKMEPEGSGSYVLLSNMYAERGKWDMVAKIRKGMREKGVKKVVGLSWFDGGDTRHSMHKFSSNDGSHPRANEIYSMAEILGSEMKFLEGEFA